MTDKPKTDIYSYPSYSTWLFWYEELFVTVIYKSFLWLLYIYCIMRPQGSPAHGLKFPELYVVLKPTFAKDWAREKKSHYIIGCNDNKSTKTNIWAEKGFAWRLSLNIRYYSCLTA